MNSTPPEPTRPIRSAKNRTTLVTAAAIAGVLLAGTAAVAANIGILNAADSSAIGDLAATDDLVPAPDTDITSTTDILTNPAPTATTDSTTGNSVQQYDIAGVGSVWIATTTSGLALDHVVAEDGWNPVLTQSDLRSLRVDFSNADRTIVVIAALADDGEVVVDVTEPTTVVGAPAATVPPATISTSQDDGDDRDDHYVDDDRDERDEHEGSDDDD